MTYPFNPNRFGKTQSETRKAPTGTDAQNCLGNKLNKYHVDFIFEKIVVIPGRFTVTGQAVSYKIDVFVFPGQPVEIDGPRHDRSLSQGVRDEKKEAYLQSLGCYKPTLRFTNKQVLQDADSCVKEILAAKHSL